MKCTRLWPAVSGAALIVWGTLAPLAGQEKPQVKVPESGVPQIMTIEGQYVRAAYNNEGYVIIGYKMATLTVGEEWLLLDMGATIRDGVPNYKLHRGDISLETPDGTKLPLPTVQEYRQVDLRALDNRAKVARDSINYFPPMASQPCRIGFFSDVDDRPMSWDEVELSNQRACLGRLYFHVPGGIKHGQHWLDVKFEQTLVRVPFRVFTKEEEKLVSKNYRSLKKQVDEAFKPPKKNKSKDKQS
jgi:hypothetical protein